MQVLFLGPQTLSDSPDDRRDYRTRFEEEQGRMEIHTREHRLREQKRTKQTMVKASGITGEY